MTPLASPTTTHAWQDRRCAAQALGPCAAGAALSSALAAHVSAYHDCRHDVHWWRRGAASPVLTRRVTTDLSCRGLSTEHPSPERSTRPRESSVLRRVVRKSNFVVCSSVGSKYPPHNRAPATGLRSCIVHARVAARGPGCDPPRHRRRTSASRRGAVSSECPYLLSTTRRSPLAVRRQRRR